MCAASRATTSGVKGPLLRSGRLLYAVARPALDAAHQAATSTLLNCYLREGGRGVFEGDELVLPELEVRARVTYRSAFFHHRFRGLAHRHGEALPPPELAELLARALDEH